MKIIVIGGTGTIGKAVVEELSKRHEVVIVGHQQANINVDITNKNSINDMYKYVGRVDGVVVTTGKVHFGPVPEMTDELYQVGLTSKLLGQVNLVLLGIPYIDEGGSFTLTSGILNRDPIRYGSSASMVNGAIDAFVKAAAIEMPKRIRINAVSPTVLSESMANYGEYFRGFIPVPAATVAQAYSKSVEGAQTGQIYCVG